MTNHPITPKKLKKLQDDLKELGIKQTELIEQFTKGSGKGGQKVNKTASCVQLKHKPTGIIVKCAKSRSREINRFLAKRQLCDQIKYNNNSKDNPILEKQLKIQKQKKRRARRSKEKTNPSS